MNRQLGAEEMLNLINEATAPLTGGEYFRSLTGRLAQILGVHAVLVTECLDYPENHVRTLAYWEGNDYQENFAFDLVGTPCEDVIHGDRFCFHPEGMAQLYPEWSRMEGGVESFIGIPIHAPANGRRRVIGHIAIYHREALGEAGVVESVFRIIAARAGAELQRIQAEAALRDSEEKYRLLVENQSDLVIKVDADGRLQFASPSYCALFGIDEARAPGNGFPVLENGDEAIVQHFRRELATAPHVATIESTHCTEGERRVLWWSARGISGGVEGFVATGRDITAQRQAEERARRHLDELAHVSRLSSLGEVASVLAHEIRQPLNSIASYTAACINLLGNGDTDPAQLRGALERVADNATRAGQIVRNLHSWVRKGTAEHRLVDLNDAVHEAVALLEHEAAMKDIGLCLRMHPQPLPVRADAIQIQQVIFNLARNGFQAMAEAGSDPCRLFICTARAGVDEVSVSVRDTGPGVPVAVRERLFQPFVTSRAEGMGIGLSISATIAAEHGGRLEVKHPDDGGAEFVLTMPECGEDVGEQ